MRILKSAKRKLWRIFISLLVFLFVWEIILRAGGFSQALFPGPMKVLGAWKEMLLYGLKGSTSEAALPVHIFVSLGRFFAGYLLAVAAAVSMGLILGCFYRCFEYIDPVLQILRPIAPVAWMPFIVLWFGIGDVPAIVIIFIAGFFPILLSTVSAVRNIDPIYHKVAANFCLSGNENLRKIILPAVFSQIITSLRLALGTSWIFLVSGEMIGSQSGLGFLIMDTKNAMRYDALLAVIFTIGIIGFLLDTAISLLERIAKK